MTIKAFLVQLHKSPKLQEKFFTLSRKAVLGALYLRYPFAKSADIEEALSETYIALIDDKISGFQSTHPIETDEFMKDLVRYLAHFIAFRKLVDIYRKAGAENNPDVRPNRLDDDSDSFLESLISNDPTPLENYETKHLSALLYRCINMLSDKLRAVVNLFLADLSQKEIVSYLALSSTGTVKSRQWEALQKLKSCMGVKE